MTRQYSHYLICLDAINREDVSERTIKGTDVEGRSIQKISIQARSIAQITERIGLARMARGVVYLG